MIGPTVVLAGAGLRGRRRIGMAAAFVVLVLAAAAMAAGLVVSGQGAPLLDEAAEDARVAHLVVSGDPAAVVLVAADPEVVAWSGPFSSLNDVELALDGDRVPMELRAVDDPEITVNRAPLRAGRWVAAADEIVLDRSLAADLGIEVGDTIVLERMGASLPFAVVGTAVNFTDCFYPQCDPGRAWVSEDGLARFAAGDAVYAQVWLRFDDPAQADPFVERLASTGIEGIGGTESWLDTRDDFLSLDRVFGAFVAAFGVFVLAVAAVVIAGSTAMRIVARRREIGLLGAIGCTPRQVTSGLLVENLALGCAAAVTGWFLAGFLAPALQLGIGTTLGPQDPSWNLMALAVCLVTIAVLLFVATIVPAVSAARRPVTDVLRDVPPDRVSRLNRWTSGMPRRLPLLGVQEAASQPARGALASLAIAVAVVGTLVSVGFVAGIDAVTADPATAGDPWDVALVPGDVPPADVEAVLDGLTEVESWFSEVSRRSTFDEGAFLSVATGGDPDAAGYVVVEGRSLEGEGDAIAGYGFLERFDVSVGDHIEVMAGTTPIAVDIVGWYRDTEDSGEVLRYRMESLLAAEAAQGSDGETVTPDVYRVTAAAGVDPAVLAADLAAAFGSSVRVEVLDTGTDDVAPLVTVLRLIALVLLVMAGANLLSTLLTSNRETAGRTGVQISLGFTPAQMKAQGAVSGAALGVLASVVAVPFGLALFRLLSDTVSSSLGVGPGWMPMPSPAVVVGLVVGAVTVAAALGAAAVSTITRRSVSDLVRGE